MPRPRCRLATGCDSRRVGPGQAQYLPPFGRLLLPCGGLRGRGEVVPGGERAEVVGAEVGRDPLERLLIQGDRLGHPTDLAISLGEVIADGERVEVIRAELGGPEPERLLQYC